MKKMLFALLLSCLLIACSENKDDKYVGKWIDSEWKSDSRALEITKKGKNKYIVKSSFDKKEKSAVIDKEDENVLIIGEGVFSESIKYDNGTKELQTLSRNYVKIDDKLQVEIDEHIKGLIEEIKGKWRLEEKELNVLSMYDRKTIEIYNYEIKESNEKNSVDIEVELLRTKDNKKIISKGTFEILSNGQIVCTKTTGENKNFFPNTFLMNVSEIKRFEKIAE